MRSIQPRSFAERHIHSAEKFVANDFGKVEEKKRKKTLCARLKKKQVLKEDSTSSGHLDLAGTVRVSMPKLKFSTETISLRMATGVAEWHPTGGEPK